LPDDVEALVVSVAEVWLPPPPPSSYEILEDQPAPAAAEPDVTSESAPAEAHTLAKRASSLIVSAHRGWAVRTIARSGSPASIILDEADRWNPDLIVAGSHGRSAIGRFILGSVSQRIVTEARHTVRIGRSVPGVRSGAVRMLVGMDGSPGSEAAVREIASRKWSAGSTVHIACVYDPVRPTAIGALIPPIVKLAKEEEDLELGWARSAIDDAAKVLAGAALAVSPVLLPGDPRRVLVEQAKLTDADCIFVGARGLSRLSRLLLGSVSAAVTARAECSVEVVR
jgi:nucleotide-binding universal stress UspA family protein